MNPLLLGFALVLSTRRTASALPVFGTPYYVPVHPTGQYYGALLQQPVGGSPAAYPRSGAVHLHQYQPFHVVPYPFVGLPIMVETGNANHFDERPAFYSNADGSAINDGRKIPAADTMAKDDEQHLVDGAIMARSGLTAAIPADGTIYSPPAALQDTSDQRKQARIFYNGYPFGTNYQTKKQPVLVNGNQGQKVGILNNQYLLKLASTTRNPDGTLASRIYPEIGGGTLFNTPAGNYNGRRRR